MTADESPVVPARSLPRRLLNRLEVDRAVFFAIATRAWQFLAGPISIVVIAEFFSPELQGYYYTFASLMAIQFLAELGLHSVIINISGHEWSKLQLTTDGTIVGDDQALRRLAGLKRFVSRWYALVAVVFLLGCGLGGAVFLNQRPAGNIAWVAPWFWLVLLNSLLLWAWAYSAMLEGCNQMVTVNRVRLLQFVTGSFAVWGSMALGWGLWATVISVGVRLVWDFWLIFIRYRRFWESLPALHKNGVSPPTTQSPSEDPSQQEGVRPRFCATPADEAISWEHEIWPLQWRMAVMGIAGYLAFSLFVPVMFHAYGPVVAGQMGMTWTILTAIESAAYAWVQVRSPLFSMLAAQRDWPEMDRVFRRLMTISWSFYLLSLIALWGGLWLLNELPYSLTQFLASRLLGMSPTMVLGTAFFLWHLPRCQMIYVRAHKCDPFLVAGVVSHGLIALLVIVLGSAYGPLGAAGGMLAIVATIILPWWFVIWNRFRAERQSANELAVTEEYEADGSMVDGEIPGF